MIKFLLLSILTVMYCNRGYASGDSELNPLVNDLSEDNVSGNTVRQQIVPETEIKQMVVNPEPTFIFYNLPPAIYITTPPIVYGPMMSPSGPLCSHCPPPIPAIIHGSPSHIHGSPSHLSSSSSSQPTPRQQQPLRPVPIRLTSPLVRGHSGQDATVEGLNMLSNAAASASRPVSRTPRSLLSGNIPADFPSSILNPAWKLNPEEVSFSFRRPQARKNNTRHRQLHSDLPSAGKNKSRMANERSFLKDNIEQICDKIKNVKTICLDNYRVNAVVLGAILSRCSKLETLSFRHNFVGDLNLSYHLIPFLRQNKSLRHLDLANNRISPAGIKLLAQSLENNFTLESLILDQQYFASSKSTWVRRTDLTEDEKKDLDIIQGYLKRNRLLRIQKEVLAGQPLQSQGVASSAFGQSSYQRPDASGAVDENMTDEGTSSSKRRMAWEYNVGQQASSASGIDPSVSEKRGRYGS